MFKSSKSSLRACLPAGRWFYSAQRNKIVSRSTQTNKFNRPKSLWLRLRPPERNGQAQPPKLATTKFPLTHYQIFKSPHLQIDSLPHYYITSFTYWFIATFSNHQITTLPNWFITPLLHFHINPFSNLQITPFPNWFIASLPHWYIYKSTNFQINLSPMPLGYWLLALASWLLKNILFPW